MFSIHTCSSFLTRTDDAEASAYGVVSTTNGTSHDAEDAAPIGSQPTSEASTQSADSNFSDSDDDDTMTLPEMVEQFQRFEDELFEISSILQFMSAKTSALKAQLRKIIAKQQ